MNPLCLGDPTSSGGNVISCQLSGLHAINGKAVVVVGDKATCPLHNGTFPFIEGHPQRCMSGLAVVLEGHRLACGCRGIAAHARQVGVE